MITQSVISFIDSFTIKYKKKIKFNRNKKPSMNIYIRLSFLLKYRPHLGFVVANIGARQVQGYYYIRFFMYKGATALRHNTVIVLLFLKDPSQPLLFSIPSKLLMLHDEANFCCVNVSCVPGSISLYL